MMMAQFMQYLNMGNLPIPWLYTIHFFLNISLILFVERISLSYGHW